MKITAYFFDKYTNESIWIAGILWPLYFIPFYLFYKSDKDKVNRNIIVPIILSLIMASFTCLIFADTLLQYITFMLGVGLLVFGAMAMIKSDKQSGISFITGLCISIVAAIILYLFRFYVYRRKNSPITKGVNNLLTPGGIIWNIIMIAMYSYLLYLLFR